MYEVCVEQRSMLYFHVIFFHLNRMLNEFFNQMSNRRSVRPKQKRNQPEILLNWFDGESEKIPIDCLFLLQFNELSVQISSRIFYGSNSIHNNRHHVMRERQNGWFDVCYSLRLSREWWKCLLSSQIMAPKLKMLNNEHDFLNDTTFLLLSYTMLSCFVHYEIFQRIFESLDSIVCIDKELGFCYKLFIYV